MNLDTVVGRTEKQYVRKWPEDNRTKMFEEILRILTAEGPKPVRQLVLRTIFLAVEYRVEPRETLSLIEAMKDFHGLVREVA